MPTKLIGRVKIPGQERETSSIPQKEEASRDGGENGSSGKRDGESYVPLLTPSPTKNPSSTNEMELADDRLMFQWSSLNTTSKRPEHSATVSRNKEPDHPMAGTSPGLACPVRTYTTNGYQETFSFRRQTVAPRGAVGPFRDLLPLRQASLGKESKFPQQKSEVEVQLTPHLAQTRRQNSLQPCSLHS